MKKIWIILSLLAAIVLTALIYKYNKTYYLSPKFYSITEETEVTRIEIDHGIKINGYPEAERFDVVTITDSQVISKVIDYLSSIPLTYVREGENFNYQSGGTIFFFGKDGYQVGAVSINADNYIHDSRNVTTYKPRNKDTSVIFDLKNLDLKK